MTADKAKGAITITSKTLAYLDGHPSCFSKVATELAESHASGMAIRTVSVAKRKVFRSGCRRVKSLSDEKALCQACVEKLPAIENEPLMVKYNGAMAARIAIDISNFGIGAFTRGNLVDFSVANGSQVFP